MMDDDLFSMPGIDSSAAIPLQAEQLPANSTGDGTRFNLCANAARIANARTALTDLAQRAQQHISQSQHQASAQSQQREQQNQSEVDQHQQTLQQLIARQQHEQKQLDSWQAKRATTLQHLRKLQPSAKPDAGRAATPSTSDQDRAAFQHASQRFATYLKDLKDAKVELKWVLTALERLGLTAKSELPLVSVQGEPDDALAALRTSIAEQQAELTHQRKRSVQLRHHSAGPIIVGLIPLTIGGLIVAIGFSFGIDLPMLGILGGVALIVAVAMAVMRASANRKRWRQLKDVLHQASTNAATLAWLEKSGKLMLDPKKLMSAQADSILQEQRQRERAEEEAKLKVVAKRRKHGERIDHLEQRLARAVAHSRRALETEHQQQRAQLEHQAQALATTHDDHAKRHALQHQAALREHVQALEHDLKTCLAQLATDLDRANGDLRSKFRPWSNPGWAEWDIPAAFPVAVPLAGLSRASSDLIAEQNFPAELALPAEPATFEVSADLVLPEAGLLLVQGQDGLPVIHQAMLRLLVGSPPGKVRFTLIDPMGLGNNFSPFLRLQDIDEHVVGPKVWTSPVEIERVLADLSLHAEKVIQKYLRDRFATLADYNAVAGDLTEPYQVLVIGDFPHGFSELGLERLASLIANGPRCGIFVWIHHPGTGALPGAISRQAFLHHGVMLQRAAGGWQIPLQPVHDWTCQPEPMPEPVLTDRLLTEVGQRTADCATLALPITVALPDTSQRWSRDSGSLLQIPIGRSGAESIQQLELGSGTAQHVLIGGRTGSGKSTLLHALITAGAFWFSPEQLEYYLIDFKKGVEFKIYANTTLPHARVVAVESDREFGLSVLRALDRELDERGRKFRAANVQDLASYRQAVPADTMPRTMLIIDEFQELFIEDDAIAHDGAMLLDRFVRQGRAFGVHVVLGSQSLGGSSTLARSTIGQIGVRIALQCSEVDSQLILSDENPAARLLERPGEAIYNDRSGLSEGNTPFQVFWINDDEQAALLASLPDDPNRMPTVFEGSAPAVLATNQQLRRVLTGSANVSGITSWLGEPNALGGPCTLTLGAGAAGNVAVVGHHREATMGMVIAALCAYSASHDPQHIRMRVIDGDGTHDRASDQLKQLTETLPHDIEIISANDAGPRLTELADGCSTSDGIPTVVFVLGLQRLRDLRMADAFAYSGERGPGEAFAELLENGPDASIHTWVWCDSAANLGRSLNRTAQRHLGQRIVFQMSTGDSSDLIDDGAASQLGLHHALAVDLAGGQRHKFRPYTVPEAAELDELLTGISQRWAQ